MIALLAHGSVALLFAACVLLGVLVDQPFERNLWLSRLTGYTALGLLLASQSMSPLRRLMRGSTLLGRFRARIQDSKLMAWRRALGMAAAEAAALHFVLSLYFHLDGRWRIWQVSYLRYGLAALMILGLLWITSFPWVLRAWRVRIWTPLHRLVYVVVCLALAHAVLAPFSHIRIVVTLAMIAMVLFWLRLLPLGDTKRRGRTQKKTSPELVSTPPA